MTTHTHSLRAVRPWRPRHVNSRPDPASVDPRLATLLQLKPEDDPVPLSAWWFVVESLESAVIVRRVMAAVEPPPVAGIGEEVGRSQRAARAALEELGEGVAGPSDFGAHLTHMEPLFVLRVTIHQLALMAVRARATPVPQLVRTLDTHVDVLSRCEAATPP